MQKSLLLLSLLTITSLSATTYHYYTVSKTLTRENQLLKNSNIEMQSQLEECKRYQLDLVQAQQQVVASYNKRLIQLQSRLKQFQDLLREGESHDDECEGIKRILNNYTD